MSFIDYLDSAYTYADSRTVGIVHQQSVLAIPSDQKWPPFSKQAEQIERAFLDLSGCIDAPIEAD